MKEIIMFDNQYNCRRKCKIVSEQTTVSINYYNLYDSLYSIYVVRAYEFADKNRNLFIRQDFTIEDLLFELEILSDRIIISIYYPASSTIPTTVKSKSIFKTEKKFGKPIIMSRKNTESTESNFDILSQRGEKNNIYRDVTEKVNNTLAQSPETAA